MKNNLRVWTCQILKISFIISVWSDLFYCLIFRLRNLICWSESYPGGGGTPADLRTLQSRLFSLTVMMVEIKLLNCSQWLVCRWRGTQITVSKIGCYHISVFDLARVETEISQWESTWNMGHNNMINKVIKCYVCGMKTETKQLCCFIFCR